MVQLYHPEKKEVNDMTEDQKLDFILAGLQELKGGMAGTQEHLKKIDMRLDRISSDHQRCQRRGD